MPFGLSTAFNALTHAVFTPQPLQRSVESRLTLVQRATGQRPRTTEVTPRDTVLQEHDRVSITPTKIEGAAPLPSQKGTVWEPEHGSIRSM